MTQILLLSYSQSGDAARVAEAIARPLARPGIELTTYSIEPVNPFPFPWRSIRRFFDVLPECLLGPPPPIRPLPFDFDRRWDLVILVYQVWFLSPSLPIQGFLNSDAAKLLAGSKVITVSVSRNMWQSASETMKAALARLNAIQLDNVTVTHQGPPWATFITAPRALLWGKKNGFWRIFPPAGVGDEELRRVARLGAAIAERHETLGTDSRAPLLANLGAVTIHRRYLLPERIGWHLFRGWARVIRGLGRFGSWARGLAVYAFVIFLVSAVVIGIPLLAVLRLVFYPVLKKPLDAWQAQLERPSGV